MGENFLGLIQQRAQPVESLLPTAGIQVSPTENKQDTPPHTHKSPRELHNLWQLQSAFQKRQCCFLKEESRLAPAITLTPPSNEGREVTEELNTQLTASRLKVKQVGQQNTGDVKARQLYKEAASPYNKGGILSIPSFSVPELPAQPPAIINLIYCFTQSKTKTQTMQQNRFVWIRLRNDRNLHQQTNSQKKQGVKAV